jgi:phosphomannomutase / phosphoglucomutase
MEIPNPHVFREYDIRGHAERDFPTPLVRELGRAMGTLWSRRGARRVAICRDCRLSSPRLQEALLGGILSTGLDVVDLGLGPTPLMYFGVFHLDLDGGVMVTGSHNPPDENGFKTMIGKATLGAEDIAELRRMVERHDVIHAIDGRLEHRDLSAAYAGFVRGNIRIKRRDVRFAIDTGNGAAGPLAIAALEAAGLTPHALLIEPDGRFPVHHPDPSQPENTELLVRTVLDRGLELGIALDGDGDRIGVVDATGRVLYGDELLVLLARDLLARRPGAAILGEVKCSDRLYDDVRARGGRPILWKTGHSLIKKKMKEEHALLAGEMSGHVFFADRWFGFDDGIYAALRILEIVAASERPLHELLADLPTSFSTPELRVPASDDTKFAVVDLVRRHFAATHEVEAVDGARIRFRDEARGWSGWGLVRASNTQPVLVMRFEASTAEGLADIRRQVETVLERSSQALA